MKRRKFIFLNIVRGGHSALHKPVMRCALIILALNDSVGEQVLQEACRSFVLPGVEGVFFGDCARPARTLDVRDYLPATGAPGDNMSPALHVHQIACGHMALDAAMNTLREAALAAGFTHALLARTHEQLVHLPLKQRVEALPDNWQHAHVWQVISDVAWRPHVDVLIALASFVFVGALLPTPVPITACWPSVVRAWPSVAIVAEPYTLDVRDALHIVMHTAHAMCVGPPASAAQHIASNVLEFQHGLSCFQAGMLSEAQTIFDQRVAASRRVTAWTEHTTAATVAASSFTSSLPFTALMDQLMACRARFERAKMTHTPLDTLEPFIHLADSWLQAGSADGLVLLHAAASYARAPRITALALAAFLDTRLIPGMQRQFADGSTAPFRCEHTNTFGAQLALGQQDGMHTVCAPADACATHAQLLAAHHHPASVSADDVHTQFARVCAAGDEMPLARQLFRHVASARLDGPMLAVFTRVLPGDGTSSATAFAAAAAPNGHLPPWQWFAAWVAHCVRAPALRWATGPVFVTASVPPVRVYAETAASACMFTLILATSRAATLAFFSTPEATADGSAPTSTMILEPCSACWLRRPHAALTVTGEHIIIAVMTSSWQQKQNAIA